MTEPDIFLPASPPGLNLWPTGLDDARATEYPPLHLVYSSICGQLETGLRDGSPSAFVATATREVLSTELRRTLRMQSIAYARLLLIRLTATCTASATRQETAIAVASLCDRDSVAARLPVLIRFIRRTINAIINQHYAHSTEVANDRRRLSRWIRNNIEPDLPSGSTSESIPNLVVAWVFSRQGCRRCSEHDSVGALEIPVMWVDPLYRTADVDKYGKYKSGRSPVFGSTRRGRSKHLPPEQIFPHQGTSWTPSPHTARSVSFRVWTEREENKTFFDGVFSPDNPLLVALNDTLDKLQRSRPTSESGPAPLVSPVAPVTPVNTSTLTPAEESMWSRFVIGPLNYLRIPELFNIMIAHLPVIRGKAPALDPNAEAELREMALLHILEARLTVRDPQRPGLFYSWSAQKFYSVELLAHIVSTVLPDAFNHITTRMRWLQGQMLPYHLLSFAAISDEQRLKGSLRQWFPDLIPFNVWQHEIRGMDVITLMEEVPVQEPAQGMATGAANMAVDMDIPFTKEQLASPPFLPPTQSMQYADENLQRALDECSAGAKQPILGVSVRDPESDIITSRIMFDPEDARKELLQRCALLLVYHMLQTGVLVTQAVARDTVSDAARYIADDDSDDDFAGEYGEHNLHEAIEASWLASRKWLWK